MDQQFIAGYRNLHNEYCKLVDEGKDHSSFPVWIAQKLWECQKWKEAVINACIVNNQSWYENDPQKTLQGLISLEHKMALDPAISKEAAVLRDTYKNTSAS